MERRSELRHSWGNYLHINFVSSSGTKLHVRNTLKWRVWTANGDWNILESGAIFGDMEARNEVAREGEKMRSNRPQYVLVPRPSLP